MEFKGTKRANEYCNSIEERNPYEDYLNGYNQALKDSKAFELLNELKETITDLLCIQGSVYDACKTDKRWEGIYEIIQKQIVRKKQLIKQATEL